MVVFGIVFIVGIIFLLFGVLFLIYSIKCLGQKQFIGIVPLGFRGWKIEKTDSKSSRVAELILNFLFSLVCISFGVVLLYYLLR